MTVRKPNLVFVFADQLRASSVGCYGEEAVVTPNIDRFAESSTLFPVAVASPSICGPYRGVLLTGLNPLSNGVVVNDVALPMEKRTIGEVLANGGYDTAYIGKWHLDGADRLAAVPPSRRRGFRYWAAANFEHNYLGSKYYKDDNEQLVWEGYDAEAQIDESIKYLNKERHPDKPFSLFLSWGPPHNPYRQVPKRYLDLYDRDKIVPRPNTHEFPADDVWGYYAQITFLDEQFGRLLAELDALGLTEDTIVVFTSDHGDMHGSHGVFKKGWPWDESIRVPFIIRLPHVIPARRASFPISTIDLMPTLLSLCGLPIPAECEGVDCSPFIIGDAEGAPRSVLITNPCPTTVLDSRGDDMVPTFRGKRMEYRGVRTMTHTYVETIDEPWLLFDNVVDPYQMENLIERPAVRSIQSALASMMRNHLANIHDDFLSKERYYEQFGLHVNERGLIQGIVPNPYPASM
jgi:arylsulfatase A-like enzyme